MCDRDRSLRIEDLLNRLDSIKDAVYASSLLDNEREVILESLRLEIVDLLTVAYTEGDDTVRRSSIYGLSQIKPERAVGTFIKALRDADDHVRGWAAEGLGRALDPTAVSALISSLGDDNHYVCFSVANALRRFGVDRIFQALSTAAVLTPEVGVRRRACKLLGEIGDKRATEFLLQAIKDADADVRYEATEALRKLGDEAALPALIQALQDQSRDVRSAAVTALGNFHDLQVVGPLIKTLVEQRDLRYASMESLRGICGESCLGPILDLLRAQKRYISETTAAVMEMAAQKDQKNIPAVTEAR